jgi:hypothetical protein
MCSALAVVGVFTAMAIADPIPAIFTSEIELGGNGQVQDGRWSESWLAPPQQPGLAGNTIHAQSWDPVDGLGAQWEIAGPAASTDAVLLQDYRVDGNGVVIYYTPYTGGTLTLKDSGPWWNPADGTGEYEVDITTYSHTTTYTYIDGVPVTYRTNLHVAGVFPDYPGYELSFLVAAAAPVGEGSGPPADYPGFLPAGETVGAWGVAQKISMEIVPEPTAMALVLTGAGVLLGRRRRR